MRARVFAIVAMLSLMMSAGVLVRGSQGGAEPDPMIFVIRHLLVEFHEVDGSVYVGVGWWQGRSDWTPTASAADSPRRALGPMMLRAYVAGDREKARTVGSEENGIVFGDTGNMRWGVACVGYGWVAGAFAMTPVLWGVRRVQWAMGIVRGPRGFACCYEMAGNASCVCAERVVSISN